MEAKLITYCFSLKELSMVQQRQQRNMLQMKSFFRRGCMSQLCLQLYTSSYIFIDIHVCLYTHTYKPMESSVLKIIF